LVERFINKIKRYRRIATRYDKLAANYLAFIKLATIRIWLRVYESAPSQTKDVNSSAHFDRFSTMIAFSGINANAFK